jgi:DNA-binding NtrC family response regulator
VNDALPRTRRTQRLLVIDDDPSIHLIVRDVLAPLPIEVVCAASGEAGLKLCRERRPDVVLLDHYLPDTSGAEVFDGIRQLDPRLPVIWITASSASETAIEATRLGAFDYLTKPINLDRLAEQVELALSARQLMLVPVEIDATATAATESDVLIGRSPAMQEVYKAIGRLAASDYPVLLVGEAGTGKQLVARAIYQHGPRAAKPFLQVRCRDLPPDRLAAHLFGEQLVDGTTLPGKLDQAAGGTLLLEDLSAIDLATQSRLLRLLQERQFQRLGSETVAAADVALMITSQVDPLTLVTQKELHSDFYFALSAFVVRLPSLRERPEDVPLLAEHFVRRFANVHKSFGQDVLRVSHDALNLLQTYRWPGNVAELQSVLRRALLETKGTVLASDYLRRVLHSDQQAVEHPDASPASASTGDAVTNWSQFVRDRIAAQSGDAYAEAIAEMEQHVLRELLDHTRGNQAQAAKILGITRTSLRKRIQALGIHIPRLNAG